MKSTVKRPPTGEERWPSPGKAVLGWSRGWRGSRGDTSGMLWQGGFLFPWHPLRKGGKKPMPVHCKAYICPSETSRGSVRPHPAKKPPVSVYICLCIQMAQGSGGFVAKGCRYLPFTAVAAVPGLRLRCHSTRSGSTQPPIFTSFRAAEADNSQKPAYEGELSI